MDANLREFRGRPDTRRPSSRARPNLVYGRDSGTISVGGLAQVIYLSADVGGTFTDLVLIDSEAGRTPVGERTSGAPGPADFIATGVSLLSPQTGRSARDTDLFVHRLSAATHALP